MSNQEILNNAPKGATHIDKAGRWHKLTFSHKGFMLLNNDGYWDYCNPCTDLRSLADIKRIAELEGYNLGLANESCAQQKRITELEKKLEFASTVADLAESYVSGDAYMLYCKDIDELKEQE